MDRRVNFIVHPDSPFASYLWHSCPSDRDPYVCGDLGYCSQCPDTQYCQGGQPRRAAPQIPATLQPSMTPAESSPAQEWSSRPAEPNPLRVEEGTVTHVADGDAVTVITPNQTKLRIRLFGIDAPETPKGTKFPGQPYGNEALLYLQQLVERKRVKVEIYGTDRYRRLLATLFVDSQNIGLAMIEAGLAEGYRGPESGNPYKAHYQAAEEAARRANRGMWVLGDRYESPRDYRRRVGISKPGS